MSLQKSLSISNRTILPDSQQHLFYREEEVQDILKCAFLGDIHHSTNRIVGSELLKSGNISTRKNSFINSQ